jgi:hypothetical protein
MELIPISEPLRGENHHTKSKEQDAAFEPRGPCMKLIELPAV